MNRRDAESRTHGSTSQFTGSAFICKHGMESHCRQPNTRVPASLLSGSGTCSQQSSPPFTMSVCAYYLSLVWFPLCCCPIQARFVVFTDASLTATFSSLPIQSGDFLRPLLCNNTLATSVGGSGRADRGHMTLPGLCWVGVSFNTAVTWLWHLWEQVCSVHNNNGMWLLSGGGDGSVKECRTRRTLTSLLAVMPLQNSTCYRRELQGGV